MLLKLKNALHKITCRLPRHLWILLAIILLGVFLRSYNLHTWLDFGSDQVNDATRVGAVIDGKAPWPSYGPDMGNSGTGGRANRFRLGPIFYDAQIISAMIFGNNPLSMAYPDLLFTILSLPLFYLFLRKIFAINLSLILTGLFAVSFYALTFSHSAWNVNSIPFFSLLFLLSLYEFILAKEKTHWGWVASLGVALGIGFQLHAILLVLFPATLFFASIIWLRKHPKSWGKLGIVLVIMVILNLGQIRGEQQNSFKNSKIFLASLTGSSVESGDDTMAIKFANNLSCNFQANAYMLSSWGTGDCDFSPSRFLVRGSTSKKVWRMMRTPEFIFESLLCLAFSLFGCWFLVNRVRKSKNVKEKYFLQLIAIYASLSFFVMLPIIDTAIRYFVHLVFLPFLLLGLILNFLQQKFPRKYVMLTSIAILFLAAMNIRSIQLEVKDDFAQSRVILGSVESMIDYITEKSGSQKEIYLYSDSRADNYFKSLNYIAEKRKMIIFRVADDNKIETGKAKFYLSAGIKNDLSSQIEGMPYDNFKIFNQMTLFHLAN